MQTALLAAIATVLWFAAGFVQGMLRTTPDPELVLGAAEALRALGWLALVAAGLTMARGIWVPAAPR